MRNWLKLNCKLKAVLISLLGCYALNDTLSLKKDITAFSNSFMSVLLFGFSVVLLIQIYQKLDLSDKRGKICAIVFSAFLSIALLMGKQLHIAENCKFLSLSLWINFCVLTLYFKGFVLFLLQYFKKNSFRIDTGKIEWSWKSFFLMWIILLICWLPSFLAFYPGAFVYDAKDEYMQVATNEFTTHHPLLHVLLLGKIVCFGYEHLGSYNAGIALYTIFQMVLMSAILAYAMQRISGRLLLKKNQKKFLEIGMILFYGIFPIFPMYAVCTTKDSIFNILLFLLVILLTEIIFENKTIKRFTIINYVFIITGTFMILFRRNAIIAYVIFSIGLIFLSLKNKGIMIKISICMLCSIVLATGIRISIEKTCNASNEEKQEIYTVAIQQLARTYRYTPECFSDEEKNTLIQYIPENVMNSYDADLADNVKVYFNNRYFEEHKKEFFDLWFKMGIKKPLTYLNAWLMTSYGYWYPDTIINVYSGHKRFTFQYISSSYFGFETEPPGIRNSMFPWLEEQYRKISLEIFQQKIPALSMLFSPGFVFWIFLFSMLCSIYKKSYYFLLPLGMVFLVWLTFLLGPTFLVRYVLILWFLIPYSSIVVMGKSY